MVERESARISVRVCACVCARVRARICVRVCARRARAGQGSPAAMRNMVMKARLKRPKSRGAVSLKRETPRMASEAVCERERER